MSEDQRNQQAEAEALEAEIDQLQPGQPSSNAPTLHELAERGKERWREGHTSENTTRSAREDSP